MSNQDNQDKETSLGRSLAPLFIGWALLLGLVSLGFNIFLERRENPNQILISNPDTNELSLVLTQNYAGHYVFDGEINGKAARFLLDTGATVVAIPGNLAKRLKLREGQRIQSQTANGTAYGYLTRLERLQFGPFVFLDVDATIAPGMKGDEVLMGMNLLRQLELTQRGEELTLKALPP